MNEVLEHRISVIEANQKELRQELRRIDREIGKLEGKSETTYLVDRVTELQKTVHELNKEVFTIVGAMSRSDDKNLSTAASDININLTGSDTTNFNSDAKDIQIGDKNV